MIRSLDTLGGATGPLSGAAGGGSGRGGKSGLSAALLQLGNNNEPNKDQVSGWAPEVEILSEHDLKRIEKQEDRESRMRKRRTR